MKHFTYLCETPQNFHQNFHQNFRLQQWHLQLLKLTHSQELVKQLVEDANHVSLFSTNKSLIASQALSYSKFLNSLSQHNMTLCRWNSCPNSLHIGLKNFWRPVYFQKYQFFGKFSTLKCFFESLNVDQFQFFCIECIFYRPYCPITPNLDVHSL